MGYYIRALKDRKKHPNWKVQFISYKSEDIPHSKAKHPKKEWDIPKERWRSLGFLIRMSVEEARSRAKQLNSQAFIRKQEQRFRKLQLEECDTQRKYAAFLPEEFKEEFELRFLRSRDSQTEKRLRRISRAHTIWRAAQQLIIHVKLDPTEWFDNYRDIYDYFYERKFSMSYIAKILTIANLWGFFICKKLGKPFLPIPRPKGYERQSLVDAYYESTNARKRSSRPLTPKALNEAKEKLKQKHFNWLFISVWLGLRPQEIDHLKNKEHWDIETLPTGTKILWVFQTKLVALPKEDRWKPIPIMYDEQKFAFQMIECGNF